MSLVQRLLGASSSGPTPLLPEAGASGTPLTIVIAVLAFLASVAFASFFMVSRAADDWAGDLAGTVTIQIKGGDRDIIEDQTLQVRSILSRTDGVLQTTVIDREASLKLLEPWLGTGNLSDDIPIPAMISADVTPTLRQGLDTLRGELAAISPNVSLDDHGQWNDRLVSAANRTRGLAFVIFLMVLTATASVIVFAARAGLAANREIVEVMHLVGATDEFIADQVQRRYFSLGLRGGLLGALVAALILLITAGIGGRGEGLFLPNLFADPLMLGWLVIIPLTLCLIASIAARLSVRRMLATELA